MKVFQFIVRTGINVGIGLVCIWGVWRLMEWLWPGSWVNRIFIGVYVVDVALMISGICPRGFVDIYNKVVRR